MIPISRAALVVRTIVELSGATSTALLIGLLALSHPLPAQSRITGVVMDSLSGTARPLGGAIVTLPGLRRWSDADSLGRFAFDSVPAGRHAIAVMHSLLDSLDVTLPSSWIDVPETGEVTTVLAVPGVRSMHAMLCGASLGDGAGLLIGRVLLGDSTRPDSGFVKFTWVEKDAAEVSLSLTLQRGAVFVGCNVPAGQPIRIDASTPLGSSLPVQVTLAGLSFVHVPIHVRTGQRRLSLSVMTNDGLPIADANLSTTGASSRTWSDSVGRAALVVAAGSQSVRVSRVGYLEHWQSVDVARDTVLSITIPRLPFPLTLQRIVGRSGGLLPAGFEARRLAGFGTFLGPETLKQLGGLELGPLLAQARGVTLGFTSRGRSMPSLRAFSAGRCIPNYFVDGAPFVVESVLPALGKSRSFADLDAAVPPESILAVEVYASPVGHPPEFDLSSSTGCGTILIWTKRR